MHGVAYAALQRASPNRWIFIRAALVVGLKPCGDLAQAVEIRACVNIAAKVRKEETVRLFLFGDSVVLVPKLKESIVEDAPIGRRSAGGSLLQMAQWHSGRLPSGGHPLV